MGRDVQLNDARAFTPSAYAETLRPRFTDFMHKSARMYFDPAKRTLAHDVYAISLAERPSRLGFVPPTLSESVTRRHVASNVPST